MDCLCQRWIDRQWRSPLSPLTIDYGCHFRPTIAFLNGHVRFWKSLFKSNTISLYSLASMMPMATNDSKIGVEWWFLKAYRHWKGPLSQFNWWLIACIGISQEHFCYWLGGGFGRRKSMAGVGRPSWGTQNFIRQSKNSEGNDWVADNY